MRVVLQRVSSASVAIGGEIVGRIGTGLMILIGIESADAADDGAWLAAKIAKLRLFPDEAAAGPEQGRGSQMNRSITDIGGEILLVSQFTLHASTAKGTRPSFNAAARPEHAQPLYELFISQLEEALGRPVSTGQFGAMMEVAITNNGPVTLILDSKSRV
jgi:D-tyrosyl-tRNA(Tyr) deacylase